VNKPVIFAILVIPILVFLFSNEEHLAAAKPITKIYFTKTFSSSPDPGSKNGQFVLVLPPSKDSIYTGTLSFVSNSPIQMVILHQIPKEESKGQQVWSVDSNSIFAATEFEPSKSGTLYYTGTAVVFKSPNPFVVTASVDALVRGKAVDFVSQPIQPKNHEIILANQTIPITIPMNSGYFDKGVVNYVVTDVSNKTLSDKLTLKNNWDVKFAPKLRWLTNSSQNTIFVFANGVKGDGIYGFQNEVFGTSPSQEQYTPFATMIKVSWKAGQKAQELQSVEDILKAQKNSRIKLVRTNVTMNVPQVIWPGGQIFASNRTDVVDSTEVLQIDKIAKKVTFVAHRSWGPDGRTTYYIIPAVTPKGPANIMKLPFAGALSNAATSSLISDMYQFKNGIRGSGSLGFQPNVISTALDERYMPVCRVFVVEWKNDQNAIQLESISDIESKSSEGGVFVTLARPLSEDHIVDCIVVESPKSNKG